MFGLSIVKTADLEQALDQLNALTSKYANLADHVEHNNKEVNVQFASVGKALALLDSNAVLAKPKTCPVLQRTPKHVTDPVGAWESKQRVLETRLKSASKILEHQAQVEQLKWDIYEHQARKPVVIQLPPPSETAVFVQHKKYGTLGLLKGKHITILSKGNKLDVGDVIWNATPAVVYRFWDILPNLERVTFNV